MRIDSSYITRVLFFCGLGFIVCGCASQVTSEVTRFHQASLPPGETIAIVALDKAKQGSLEFSSYAGIVAERLRNIGYKVVEESAGPSLLAKMDYSVGDAQTRIIAWPRNYVHYHFYHGRYYPYYFGRYWDEPLVYSYTVYPRNLDIIIVDQNNQNMFEGHVKSAGRESSLNPVMPYMIAAMFQNFPGESGITKVVTIRKDGNREPY